MVALEVAVVAYVRTALVAVGYVSRVIAKPVEERRKSSESFEVRGRMIGGTCAGYIYTVLSSPRPPLPPFVLRSSCESKSGSGSLWWAPRILHHHRRRWTNAFLLCSSESAYPGPVSLLRHRPLRSPPRKYEREIERGSEKDKTRRGGGRGVNLVRAKLNEKSRPRNRDETVAVAKAEVLLL